MLNIEFHTHEPSHNSEVYGPYALMIVGEAARRGGERTVIAEDCCGERETLATWNPELGSDGFGRWVTLDGYEWEDVRAVAVP
jgi:hypothetical protein